MAFITWDLSKNRKIRFILSIKINPIKFLFYRWLKASYNQGALNHLSKLDCQSTQDNGSRFQNNKISWQKTNEIRKLKLLFGNHQKNFDCKWLFCKGLIGIFCHHND
ncbi:hypothetical protein [Moraxella sp.]|uniref:hypothetical protein n=1 Tax=Moraxella sp. TaxID=479 RepID=UPI0026DD0909|nr:hypothetical protein [Moraxella sp.]MDO4894429.1 hypothetical protein [Moraxella sp.]